MGNPKEFAFTCGASGSIHQEMANGQLGQVLRQIRRLIGGPAVEAATDAQLLERFCLCRDEAAFTALVVRHGPMVLGVCREPTRKQSRPRWARGTYLLFRHRTCCRICPNPARIPLAISSVAVTFTTTKR